MIKAFLTDLDGTLSQTDLLDEMCIITGKRQESARLNKEFMARGPGNLAKRIKLIEGVAVEQITQQLQFGNYLRPGTKELFAYLKANNIITILNSGNILPVVEYYQKLLGIDHIVCTSVSLKDDIIGSMLKKVAKYSECKKLLDTYSISWDYVVALGNGPGDLEVLKHAKWSIAIDPCGGVEDYANFVIEERGLQRVHLILKDLLS